MSHPSKRKGDQAERELAALLADHLGLNVRRKLGAGRHDDEGDLDGLAGWTIEAKNCASIADAIRDGLADLDREQANAGTPFGAVAVRRRGGRWIFVLDAERFAAVVREVAR